MVHQHNEDFTEHNYSRMLKLAKKNYRFCFYDDSPGEGKTIYWRHDIDFSVHRAVRLAELERSEGVSCTYFVQISSSFYNVFEKEIKEKLLRIEQMGHRLGLHFAPAAYRIDSEVALGERLRYEQQLLENLLRVKIKVFSFHNPDEEMLKNDKPDYSGMINVYSSHFRNQVGYCSDSNGWWRYRRLKEVLEEAKENHLQILTHPAWWQQESMRPKERILRCINGRAESVENNYFRILREAGRIEGQ